MKVFISQPMNGKTVEKILAERNDAYRLIKYTTPDAELINTFISEQLDEKHDGLKYLAESIKMLDEADGVFMLKDWQTARGCKIEHECAMAYGIPVYYLY